MSKSCTYRHLNVALVLSAIVIAIVALYMPTFRELHYRWINPDEPYTQSYLVVLLALYMIAHQIVRQSQHIKPVAACAWLVLPLSFFWSLAYLSNTQLPAQLLMPIFLWLWLLCLFGLRVARSAVLPVMFLYCAIPLWGWLGMPLRQIAVVVVGSWVELLNIPAYITGFFIQLPYGTVEIAGGCSGQNYFLTGLVLSAFYSIRYLHGWSRLLLLVVMLSLALLANWVRIFLLVLLAYRTQMQHPMLADHNLFGWLIFAAALIIFFVIAEFIHKRYARRAAKFRSIDNHSQINFNQIVRPCLLLFSLSTLIPLYVYWKKDLSSVEAMTLVLPPNFYEIENIAWQPEYSGFDIARYWTYGKEEKAEILALVYLQEEQGKELIQGSNRLAARAQMVGVFADNMSGYEYRLDVIKDGRQTRYVYWTYKIGGTYLVSPLRSKLKQAFSFWTGDTHSAFVSYSFICERRCDDKVLKSHEREFIKLLMQFEWRAGKGSRPVVLEIRDD